MAKVVEVSTLPIATTMDEVRANLELQLKGVIMPIPTWCGTPGMAKTAHAKILAEEMGLEMLYVSMNRPYEYFSGLPITNSMTFDESKDKNEFQKQNYTHWTQPDMIHVANKMAIEIEKTGKFNGHTRRGVMIMLDDLHCASDSVQKYFYEIILERSLNNFKLAPNICIMAAMNGSTDSGFDGFFAAIMSRLQVIYVRLDFEYWYKNVSTFVHPFVAAFLRSNQNYREEEESRMHPFANYRSWTMLGRLLIEMYGNNYNIPLKHGNGEALTIPDKMYNLAKAFVSDGAANEFRQSVAQFLEFDFDSMIENNNYSCKRNDVINQLMFGCVVRNIKTVKQGKQFEVYLKSIFKDKREIQMYSNVILSICTNIGTILNHVKDCKKNKTMTDELATQEKIAASLVDFIYSIPEAVKILVDITI